MSDSQNPRKYNYTNENLIFLISTIIALEISQGKTPNEIDILSIILQNVATQLASISDVRVLSDDNSNDSLILPIIP